MATATVGQEIMSYKNYYEVCVKANNRRGVQIIQCYELRENPRTHKTRKHVVLYRIEFVFNEVWNHVAEKSKSHAEQIYRGWVKTNAK